MNDSSPLTNNTSSALRMAFGPGYGFGVPTDRQFQIVVGNTPRPPVHMTPRRKAVKTN